jgi:NTE family protein
MIEPMLGAAVDIFRLRQYFNVVTRTRELIEGVREDGRLVAAAGRALTRLPLESEPARSGVNPFALARSRPSPALRGRRIGLVATGGSGALASVVGVARAFEEDGVRPAVISLCSGSALFGFPFAAGLPASQVAAFTLGLRPEDYIDVSWGRLATLVPRAGRGFAGLVEGARIEATYRRLLGDRRLGDLPIPAYAPIWSVEHNRVDYVGPATHPDLPVARTVHMAIALPCFLQPVAYDGQHWCDGGIVDIFPVHPVLDIEEPCDAVDRLPAVRPHDRRVVERDAHVLRRDVLRRAHPRRGRGPRPRRARDVHRPRVRPGARDRRARLRVLPPVARRLVPRGGAVGLTASLSAPSARTRRPPAPSRGGAARA